MTPGRPAEPLAAGTGNRTALSRLLGVAEMAWLVERVRGRMLAGGQAPLSGVVQLLEPTAEQRAAAVRLVGQPKRAGSTLRLDLAVVEQILRRGPWPAGLADAVVTLSGPVVDHRAERERDAAAWDAVRDGLTAADVRFPGLADWWDAWCAAGGLKRAARAEAARTSTALSPAVGADLVSRLAAVLAMLPASGEPLAVLARQAVGDAHGLDASRPLGRLAAAAVGAAFSPETVSSVGGLSNRDVWAAAGVVLSNVASTVLCLGVPGISPVDAEPANAESAGHTSRTATATSLEAMRAARMPMLLTLDQVRSRGVRVLRRGDVIHVCENPTVVEVVAERWARAPIDNGVSGAVDPVLVCTWGQPSTAVVELLKTLAGDGAECRYHGDFDWAGLRIARSLSMHVTWEPWRYRAADYRAAVPEGRLSRPLTGDAAESPWDPELSAAMTERGLAVDEEAVADLLAVDVLAGSTSRDAD